jgi:probable F420-dependent oxidoreductase
VPTGPKLVVNPKATHYSMPVVDVARAAAERGFDGLYLCEHTHIPVDHPRSQSPATGSDLPRWITCLWDPYIALAFVAATTGLEIGTSVALPAEHDAIILAKELATLDELSGGRLVLGAGWGWNREEFEHHGFPADRRVEVLRDKLALMRAIWTDEEAHHDGPYVHMAPSWSWPKPRRAGGPPVLLGVAGIDRNFRRIAEWGDGWIPMATPLRHADQADFGQQLERLRATWVDHGRRPDGPEIAVVHPADPVAAVPAAVERAAGHGVQRVIIQVDDLDAGGTVRVLDGLAAALAGRLTS